MLYAKTRWKVGGADRAAADRLAAELKLHPVVAGMMVSRGLTDVEEAARFFQTGKDRFHDPFLLDGMADAVARVRLALERGEKIRVYGDYDADGVSSTSLMTHLFRRLGADFDTYIPHRVHEGYGLNNSAIDLAKQSGVSLIVTVDTGISAKEQVAYAAGLGIDVVVTDHHEPPEELPEAAAVVNPKKPGCPYPFKGLAGVGVAFKLAHALLGEVPEAWLELAAIGTVADLMPLVGENRLIVKLGIERMQASEYVGVRALLDVAGLTGKDVTATHLAFALAPRINASGRLDHAEDAVRLLTTENREEADRIAESLDSLNKERQRLVEETVKEALALVAEQDPQSRDKVIVVAAEGWNAGVIGIVAAKLLERFYRPVVVLAIEAATGSAKGSARSIPGYDIYRALTHCAELLDHYGGHQAAAGMTVHRDQIGDLRMRLNKLADEWLTEDDMIPISEADAEIAVEDVTVDCIRQIESLAPFGMGNPSPRFVLTGLTVQDRRALGREGQHLKLTLAGSQGEANIAVEAIGFGIGGLLETIASSARVDVLGELNINEWNGVRKPQIVIQDIRVPHVQVYDWRGTRQPVGKFAEVAAVHRERVSGKPGSAAMIVREEGYAGRIDPDAIDCGLWAMGERSLIPLNREARETDFAEASDLLIVSLPDRLEHLERALAGSRAERVYAAFADWNRDFATMPPRESFKAVYQAVVRQGSWESGDWTFLDPVRRKIGLSESLARFVVDVFEELEFIRKQADVYSVAASPRKRDLAESRLYRARLARADVEQLLIYSNARQLADWIAERLAVQPNRMMEVLG